MSTTRNCTFRLSPRGRYRALAPKVSHAAGSPVCVPTVNHFWRDADEPWVKVSGETRPRVARWCISESKGVIAVREPGPAWPAAASRAAGWPDRAVWAVRSGC
jgi:hypothetical protein